MAAVVPSVISFRVGFAAVELLNTSEARTSENVGEIFSDTDVQDNANTSVVIVTETQHADNEWSNPKQKFKRKKTNNKNKLQKTTAVSGPAADDVKPMSPPSKNETVIIGTGEPGDNASANDFGAPCLQDLAILTYAPSDDERVGTKQEFYEELEEISTGIGQNREIIMLGDFNPRTGRQLISKVVGPHEEDQVNDNVRTETNEPKDHTENL
ncbi:hypothetical protein HHI36_000187 [Cryptolaemus montrouzieri]|uniref:Uncharacterized protein n=1 Tax=Cryptolaemus montrouzieri TaxID=559131 RepID=A0ABD2P3X9_9CUCU